MEETGLTHRREEGLEQVTVPFRLPTQRVMIDLAESGDENGERDGSEEQHASK